MENSSKKQSDSIVTNDEVNYNELIDMGRKLVNGDDIKLGLHYITLALLSPNIDTASKIQASAIKSYAHFKLKDDKVVMSQVKKILRYLSKNKWDTLDSSLLFCAVRMLFRGGCQLIELKQIYVAALCLSKSKQLFELRSLKDERESQNTLEETFNPLMKNITAELNLLKEKYNILEGKGEEVLQNLIRLKNIFAGEKDDDRITSNPNDESKSTETPSEENNHETFYLISTAWIKNLMVFIDKFEKYAKTDKFTDHLDKIFNRKYVLNLYFSGDGNYELAHYGIYPSEVNNFHIVNFKDSWTDTEPSQLHTNIYIKKGLKENIDFFYVNESDWKFIFSIFGCNYEIIRKTANISNNLLIEIKVLILNDTLRDKSINLIKPRNIQISKELKIKDLKMKIIRLIKEYIDNPDADSHLSNSFQLYLFNFGLKDNKKETFEMIYSYKNKFKSHNLIAEEVKDDELLLENLNYGPGDLLVVEVDTHFINKINEQRHCNMCKKTLDEPFRCINCFTFVYCSESCRKTDEIHIKYHINVNKLYKKKFNIQELAEIKIEDLLERGAKHGLVGLKNLGNTCFMNSALQCLSNCEELTKYFLTRKVFDEINKNNSHGTGGEVAKAYYELLRELWQGESNYLCPTDFRQIFVRFVQQFAGFSQHDSHEMLTFMLDALHEDLNRVRQKPYVEMNEQSENESEIDASKKWWKNHLTRENSVIVDLFHGQYKSVITCPECNRISITYDPFMYLGLPIPSGHFKIKFKFFSYPNEMMAKNYINEYELPINDHTTIKDMKNKVTSSKGSINLELLDTVCLNKEKIFKKFLRDDELVFNYFDNGLEIVIYERYPSTCKVNEEDDYITFYIHPSELIEERSMLVFKKSYQKLLSYPTLISLHKNNTVKDLYFQIYKSFRKVLNIDEKNFNLKNFLENINNNNKYTEEEFKFCFNRSEEFEPFKLHIINNVPESSGFFISSKSNCEFCGYKCEYCQLSKGELGKSSLESLLARQSQRRPFLIYLEITKIAKNMRIFENVDFPFNIMSKNLITKQSSINIYDCINLFRSEERLEKENAWYCSKCAKHQEAFKRLEIYKPPNFLIVQFKRFKIRSNSAVMGMIANKKNDVLIEYPVEGLDLREYVVGTEKGDAVYDLVGISQHFGGLSSGHYTALCKNFGRWYEFDDERILKAANSDVVNNSAYMLFYRKRILK